MPLLADYAIMRPAGERLHHSSKSIGWATRVSGAGDTASISIISKRNFGAHLPAACVQLVYAQTCSSGTTSTTAT